MAGFTLLEMIITISIFVLIAGAVFGIMVAVLSSAKSLGANQDHHDQIVALNDFMRKKLTTLPARSGLTTYKRGDGEGLAQNGIIFGDSGQATAIDAKIQANGYYTLRIATFVSTTPPASAVPATNDANAAANAAALDSQRMAQFFQEAISAPDNTINWNPLIRDIKKVTWKFQDFNATDWVDLWNNANAKPNLIEFSIQLAGDLKPATMDFWIPHLEAITPRANNNNNAPTTP